MKPELRRTLDEMWPVFGDEILQLLAELPELQEAGYEIPEQFKPFLQTVDQYIADNKE